MRRVKIFNLLNLALTFLAFVPKMKSQVMPLVSPLVPGLPPLRPICLPQIALVKYACPMLFQPLTGTSSPIPLTPSPSPLSPHYDDDEKHVTHRRHGHRHRRSHRRSPQEEICCHWASALDNQCVCEILSTLPPFLTRPMHKYKIFIGESCNVTYSCGAPI